jgi:predicted DNA-binding protein
MPEKYSRLLAARLSRKTYDRLKELAAIKRRSISGLCRLIIEDFLETRNKGVNQE